MSRFPPPSLMLKFLSTVDKGPDSLRYQTKFFFSFRPPLTAERRHSRKVCRDIHCLDKAVGLPIWQMFKFGTSDGKDDVVGSQVARRHT